MSIIFDGKAFAKRKEEQLKQRILALDEKNITLRVKTLVFQEDEASILYTKLKKAAAERIGILYEPEYRNITTPLESLLKLVRNWSSDPEVCGVMIQKPTKVVIHNPEFHISDAIEWWKQLVMEIDTKKDIDGLSPKSQILPATVSACLSILKEAKRELNIDDTSWRQMKVVVIGRSDIVGRPLVGVLRNEFAVVENVGKDFDLKQLVEFDIVVSAIGSPNLITGEMLKPGVVAIDVGAPEGDMEKQSVESVANFLTPVPGGVGPVTVISLMENIVEIGG